MRRESLVSTACACASILQNLQNLNTYGYCGPVRLRTILRQSIKENLAHVHAVDTRPSLRIIVIEGLKTRLLLSLLCRLRLYIVSAKYLCMQGTF